MHYITNTNSFNAYTTSENLTQYYSMWWWKRCPGVLFHLNVGYKQPTPPPLPLSLSVCPFLCVPEPDPILVFLLFPCFLQGDSTSFFCFQTGLELGWSPDWWIVLVTSLPLRTHTDGSDCVIPFSGIRTYAHCIIKALIAKGIHFSKEKSVRLTPLKWHTFNFHFSL
jgi:hypothetical protein